MFSAKESAFKFWFPLDRRWIDPLECTISIDRRQERFLARRADGATVQGAWVGDSTRIFTGVWA